MSFIIIYVTHKNKKDEVKVTNYLLNNKLIACSNSYKINSSYLSNNKIKNSYEIVTIYKTKKSNWKKIKQEILKIHKYEIPCIMKIKVNLNKEYENWLIEQLK